MKFRCQIHTKIMLSSIEIVHFVSFLGLNFQIETLAVSIIMALLLLVLHMSAALPSMPNSLNSIITIAYDHIQLKIFNAFKKVVLSLLEYKLDMSSYGNENTHLLTQTVQREWKRPAHAPIHGN